MPPNTKPISLILILILLFESCDVGFAGTTSSSTPSQTQSQSKTQTQSQTQSLTRSQTPSQTLTSTLTPTQSQTQSLTRSQTPSQTLTSTLTPTQSQTQSLTRSQTQSQTLSPTMTQTLTQTQTQSRTFSQTQTQTRSLTQTSTATPTRSPSQTATRTPTQTRSKSQTRTSTSTPSVNITPYPAGYFPAPYYSGSAGLESPCPNSLTSLYAFGAAAGDTTAKSDDGCTQLSMPSLWFYDYPYAVVCVYANGAVIFKASGTNCTVTASYSALSAPFSSLGAGVFLFYADIDTAPVMTTSGYPSAAQNTQYSEYAANVLHRLAMCYRTPSLMNHSARKHAPFLVGRGAHGR